MARITYTKENYELVKREEMDEGMDYHIGSIEPDPSLNGVRLALLMGPCPEEPEIVVPLDFLKASGTRVDIIAPDWTPHDWLPATRFWTPTLKIPYQKKISEALVSDYRGIILVGGTWNPAVVRTDTKLLEFVKEAAMRGLPFFTICHGAQILISAGLVTKGLKVTGSPDIRIDLHNAGADVVEDEAVIVDMGCLNVEQSIGMTTTNFTIVSSRDPNDLEHFCRAIADHFRA
jgi:protease I